jgi:hypothetical protein
VAASLLAQAPSGVVIGVHHFGQDEAEREATQSAFDRGEVQVLVTDSDLTVSEGQRDLTKLIGGEISKFMSRESFLAWAKENGVTSQLTFRRRFGRIRPLGVPSTPNKVYEMTWSQITGNPPRVYARRGAPAHSLMSLREFLGWVIENEVRGYGDFQARFRDPAIRPARVPSNPHISYEMGWGHLLALAQKLADGQEVWLSDHLENPRRTDFLDLEGIVDWLIENNVRSLPDFRFRFGRNDKRPAGVPSNIPSHYKLRWAEIKALVRARMASKP